MELFADPEWNYFQLQQDNAVTEEAYDYADYYYQKVWDPAEIYGYGCFDTTEGYTICIDPAPCQGNYWYDWCDDYYYGYYGPR